VAKIVSLRHGSENQRDQFIIPGHHRKIVLKRRVGVTLLQ